MDQINAWNPPFRDMFIGRWSWISLALALFVLFESMMSWCIIYQIFGKRAAELNKKNDAAFRFQQIQGASALFLALVIMVLSLHLAGVVAECSFGWIIPVVLGKKMEEEFKEIPAERQVYCNRTLNLKSISAIGYDMDYTLIHYRAEVWELRTYEYLKQQFLTDGWPVEQLSLIRTLFLGDSSLIQNMAT